MGLITQGTTLSRNNVMNFKSILQNRRPALIVGAGGSLKEYHSNILNFIKQYSCCTIGINNVTDFIEPEYHLWTNNQRFMQFSKCISSKSNVIIGYNISKKTIRKHYSGPYESLKFKDEKGMKFQLHENLIQGCFRTAGVLAIAVAKYMASKDIFVCGMDGYTFHPKQDLKSKVSGQHCYGKGHTDDSDWDDCVKKDKEVYKNLLGLYEIGMRFSIITPTKFDKFYSPILEECS